MPSLVAIVLLCLLELCEEQAENQEKYFAALRLVMVALSAMSSVKFEKTFFVLWLAAVVHHLHHVEVCFLRPAQPTPNLPPHDELFAMLHRHCL